MRQCYTFELAKARVPSRDRSKLTGDRHDRVEKVRH
jgi:hypothetical protein